MNAEEYRVGKLHSAQKFFFFFLLLYFFNITGLLQGVISLK